MIHFVLEKIIFTLYVMFYHSGIIFLDVTTCENPNCKKCYDYASQGVAYCHIKTKAFEKFGRDIL